MSADERIGSESRGRLVADLALLGGRLALERFHRAQVALKRDERFVADAGAVIQEALGCEIARLFPTDGLVGEEGSVGEPRRQARYAWVLEPIDGADNFARGVPGFAVSVGVLRDRMPFAGAVYDPVARWLFTGCAGRGAWLNDRPLRVRAAPMSDGDALFAMRAPCAGGVPDFVDGWLQRHRLRSVGSAALHLCYVALGALDFVHDEGASLWNIAGAATVLLEAGGVLTTDDGAPLFPITSAQAVGEPISLLAGHPRWHANALRDRRAGRGAPSLSAAAR
ncbi:MAG TPA: inositol monophosphatase [Methylomirabilota bacterium]|jgi:myo-inositol-1(or 4)-monophosphatase